MRLLTTTASWVRAWLCRLPDMPGKSAVSQEEILPDAPLPGFEPELALPHKGWQATPTWQVGTCKSRSFLD
ncbi:hypothetical protein GCM10009753_34630 [Streptantibioticus ferralitis]